MSQENVELLRRTVDAINRGDIDGALKDAADDFEVDWSNAIGPGRRGVHSGKDAAREFWRSFVEAFDELRWDFEERSSRWTSRASSPSITSRRVAGGAGPAWTR